MQTILVVDDQSTNLQILTDLLSGRYSVLLARGGDKALSIAASEQKPDLILLDIMMPGIDGYEVCRRLKADPDTADIPVIFVSAKGEVLDEKRGLELGAVDYITKPYSMDILLARVHTHLSLSSLTRGLEQKVKERTLELRQSLAEADVARHAKEQFLANMNHELRTPLNAIIGFSTLLQQSHNLDDDEHTYAKTAHQAAQTLLRRIEEILSITRSEDGALKPHPAPFALHDCIDQAIARVSPAAEGKHINITVETDHGMPEGLESDAGLISHALSHVLDNAIKFSPEGSTVTIEHQLIEEPLNTLWQISVNDTGIGIPIEYREILFDAFQQIDGSTQRQFEGMGIGLNLTQRLINLLEGRIDFDSEPGKGSQFHLRIPVKRLSKPLSLSPQAELGEMDVPSRNSTSAEAHQADGHRPIDREALAPMLDELRQALENYDTGSTEIAWKCAQLLNETAEAKRIEPLLAALTDYDFEQAQAALPELLALVDTPA